MDKLVLYEQFRDLCFHFPTLSLEYVETDCWIIKGLLKFSATYQELQIQDEYEIDVKVSDKYPTEIPSVRETGNRIPHSFHHYRDDSLCLGAPLGVKKKFLEDPTLIGFFENSLVPYLYTFSYKCKFRKLPYGELSHGPPGILEYYRDLFQIEIGKPVLDLLQILADNHYRGHHICPCGSGKRLRSCHGPNLLSVIDLQSPSDFQRDFLDIMNFLKELRRREHRVLQK